MRLSPYVLGPLAINFRSQALAMDEPEGIMRRQHVHRSAHRTPVCIRGRTDCDETNGKDTQRIELRQTWISHHFSDDSDLVFHLM